MWGTKRLEKVLWGYYNFKQTPVSFVAQLPCELYKPPVALIKTNTDKKQKGLGKYKKEIKKVKV